MNKAWKFIQYGYLFVSAIVFIDGVFSWNTNRERAYISFGLAIFITIIFFVKRNFRRKIEERNRQKNQ